MPPKKKKSNQKNRGQGGTARPRGRPRKDGKSTEPPAKTQFVPFAEDEGLYSDDENHTPDSLFSGGGGDEVGLDDGSQPEATEDAVADIQSVVSVDANDPDVLNEAPPNKRRKVCGSKGGTESQAIPDVVILRVATAKGSSARREIPCNTDWDDACEIIHDAMGCENIPIKPSLTYRLANWTTKTLSSSLNDESDWDGCVKDVRAYQSKKKDHLTVQIGTTDQYLKSFAVALKKKKSHGGSSTAAAGSSNTRNRRGKVVDEPILDLLTDPADKDDDEMDDEGGSTSIMELEQQWAVRLNTKYAKCQLCGPKVMCKIGWDNNHHHIKHAQSSAWTNALALRMAGVTLDTPPKTDLFAMWHKSLHKPSSIPLVAPPLPVLTQSGPSETLTSTPMVATAALLAKTMNNTSSASPAKSTGQSSDGGEREYPNIVSFIAELHTKQPQRNLDLYGDVFGHQDLYCIDELADMSVKELMADEFGLSFGNAKYLLTKV
ncbi:hypothetical protein PQX77_015913 [Marasmius sp. AFHP31]|nr:hypothetical protein PQX77_015913 [Marasmius sp. AFHP31]